MGLLCPVWKQCQHCTIITRQTLPNNHNCFKPNLSRFVVFLFYLSSNSQVWNKCFKQQLNPGQNTFYFVEESVATLASSLGRHSLWGSLFFTLVWAASPILNHKSSRGKVLFTGLLDAGMVGTIIARKMFCQLIMLDHLHITNIARLFQSDFPRKKTIIFLFSTW